MINTLFVYGTLKQDEARGSLFGSWMNKTLFDVKAATVQADLYDLGVFPAIVPGKGTVYGEAVTVKNPALMKHLVNTVDMIEGYSGDPEHPENMYVRKKVPVCLATGEVVEAYAYFFAREDFIKNFATLIEGGIWSEFKVSPQ